MQNSTDAKSGNAETIVLIKAAPVIGQKHGETVCCAGIDIYGHWHRMFPVSFRLLEDAKRFGRWDIVTYNWRKPTDDDRVESRHVDSQTLEISGRMKKTERANFLDNHIVTSLKAESEAGRSLALLRPTIKEFVIVAKSQSAVAAEQRKIDNYHAQADMFAPPPGVPAQRAHTNLNINTGPMTVIASVRAKIGKPKPHSTNGAMSTGSKVQ